MRTTKTKFYLLLTLIVPSLLLAGCGNKTVFDTTYTFNYAQVKLQDGTVKEGKIDQWRDYSDGDQVQIKFADGQTVLVHSVNVTLSTTDME